MGVITVKPPYHAKVQEYTHPDLDLSLAIKNITLVKIACDLRSPTPHLKAVCFYNTPSDSIVLYTPLLY